MSAVDVVNKPFVVVQTYDSWEDRPEWDVSAAQARVLRAVEDLSADGWPVTVREAGRAAGLASPSTAFGHLLTLEGLGLIERHPRNPRGGFRVVRR